MIISPRNNVVLVLLPDSEAEKTNAAGLFVSHALTPAVTYGKVYKVGPKVADVRVGDVVAFPPTAGDPMDIGAYQCLFLRETEIVARIPRHDVAEAKTA